MMDQAIRDFPQQFSYEPTIENAEKLIAAEKFLVCAMGGSAHSSGLLNITNPEIDLLIHRAYGLPVLPDKLEGRLIVIISYSGNTEEPLDAYRTARERNLPVVAIAKGGQLIEMAKKDAVPYVQIPDTGIQPRNGTGFTLRAQLKLMGRDDLLAETDNLREHLNTEKCEPAGKALADRLEGKVPIMYASYLNDYLAYVWKIKFNETGKVPAYRERFPELNHNEMQGYYITDATKRLSQNFYFLFLRDENDHPRIRLRMEVTKKLYAQHGLAVEDLPLQGNGKWERLFTSLFIADWASYHLAKKHNADPEKVEMIESLKHEIA